MKLPEFERVFEVGPIYGVGNYVDYIRSINKSEMPLIPHKPLIKKDMLNEVDWIRIFK